MPSRSLACAAALLVLAACGRGRFPDEDLVLGDAGSRSGALGSACVSRSECLDGLGCLTETSGFPGGLCSKNCSAASCPSTGLCVDLTATSAAAIACAHSCQLDADCRDGYSCCKSVGACLPQAMCAAAHGRPDAGTDGGADGGTDAGTDGGGTDGGHDGGGTDGGSDGGPIVFRTCTPPGTPHLRAGGTAGPASKPTSCQKAVQPTSFSGGRVLPLGRHTVGDQVTFDVPANTQSVSIVSQAISATDSVTYQGQVIPNSVVPTMVAQPDGGLLWNDEDATVTNDPTKAPTYPVWYLGTSPNTGVMTIPGTSASLSSMATGAPAGRWSMKVNDFALECQHDSKCSGGNASNVYDVGVLLKPGPPQSSGTVDIGLYLATSTLTAATAVSNASVQRMVQTLSTLYGRAGVCLGEVTIYDLPQWARTAYATGINADKTGPCDELDQMFTLAQPGNTLNFFLVESITSQSAGGQVVGIDGTIPGPSSIGGTVHSGAAVSIADLTSGTCSGTTPNLRSCGADVVAYIAAHEGGHWLGLYHTSEAVGVYFDPIADTGICKCQQCVASTKVANCIDKNPSANPPTLVNATDCNKAPSTKPDCGGADNLMFWLIDQTVSVGNFSADQSRVVRANAVVQ